MKAADYAEHAARLRALVIVLKPGRAEGLQISANMNAAAQLVTVSEAHGIRLVIPPKARYPKRPYLTMGSNARYHWRLALYDYYCGRLKAGNYTNQFINGTTPDVLLRGWQQRRAELQRELEGA
jgi:hypothetical protein